MNLIRKDFQLLIEHSLSHKTAKLVATVAQTTSWCRLWDIALDRGVKGTRGLQAELRELSQPGPSSTNQFAICAMRAWIGSSTYAAYIQIL